MQEWKVTDELSTELGDVRDANLTIIAGEVVVTADPGPARIDVRWIAGDPVEVTLDDGRLRLRQPKRREGLGGLIGSILSGRTESTVVLNLPSDAVLDAKTVSAPIVVSGVRGGTSVKSVSGDVTLKDLAENVSAKTVSGNVEAKSIAADVKAQTVSGSLTLVDGACRWLRAKSVSGDVLLDLELDPTGVYEVGTVSGEVAFRVDAEPNLVVEASSLSGGVASDFGLDWSDVRPGGRTLRETIGDGGARLAVKTVSGELRIVRRREAAA